MTILRDRLLKYGFHIFGSLFFEKTLKRKYKQTIKFSVLQLKAK